MKKLEEMISEHAYDEIVAKAKKVFGKKDFDYKFLCLKTALERGDGLTREHILGEWLQVDSVRVCSTCGALMEEGWYLNLAGYACSDECAAKSEGLTMEEFDKYQIYKDDIIEYLKDEGKGRKIEDLTKRQCRNIINKIWEDKDYYWTEWY